MQIIDINSDNIDAEKIESLAEHIKLGHVLVFPTDTIPGLIADATNREAVEKIFEIKRRPGEKRFPIFIPSIDMAKELAEIDDEDLHDINGNWPGAFTYILNRVPYHKELFGLDADTIALRIPDYEPLNMLLNKIGVPLVQTSVNTSGTPALKNTKEIVAYLDSQKIKPEIIVDTGKVDFQRASRIIDLTRPDKKIIRI